MSHQIETRCIHGETHKYREDSRAISFPIYQTASFAHIEPGITAAALTMKAPATP